MYAYEFDPETGGLLLLSRTPLMSKEPRPVYAQEMDFLGLDNIWEYEKQQEIPYLWAESNVYWYRGQVVGKTTGGSLYEAPEFQVTLQEAQNTEDTGVRTPVLPEETILIPVDILKMVEKNREILESISYTTAKMIYHYYNRMKKKMDCFHVAFSGGKDSIVLLDLVKKSLPNTAFMVVFGDTGMEFPDTYVVVDRVEEECINDGIAFYRASSHLKPMESWKLFGPPSRVLRWCCNVHKSTPQTLKIREVLQKSDYIGVDFVGVRRHESVKRSEYEYENFGKKQKGQFSHNPILDWNSAEIWMYLYTNNLPINEAYKKGNSRAGCLFCPMGGGKGDFFQQRSYPEEINCYIQSIHETNARNAGNETALSTYVSNGGWNARKNGRDLTISQRRYEDVTKDGVITIKVENPLSDWKQWIKTVDVHEIHFDYQETENGYILVVKESEFQENPKNKKKFKQIFKKSAHCNNCRACETNCTHNAISFHDGLEIKNCTQCGQCHEIETGCLAYHSLRLPASEGGTRKMGSINSFGNHAPKPEWIVSYLENGSDFWNKNTLGKPQVDSFKRFLRAGDLLNQKTLETTDFYEKFKESGAESRLHWAVVLVNLSYNSQFYWFMNNLSLDREYSRSTVADMLVSDGLTEGNVSSITGSWRRFCDLPLGTVLNFGSFSLNGKTISTLTRTKCDITDSRVVLYSLYKFAEACEGYYQFSLTRLLNHEIDSSGMSPTLIFGLNQEDMEGFLNGLTVEYPEFINATFTHDLDKISLMEDKTSEDVLKLF